MSFLLLFTAAEMLTIQADREPTPESRAVAYLVREVPRWSEDNKCYSCHNNGDAARALYVASRRSFTVPAEALDDTTRWLSRPQQWEQTGKETAANDKGLARIQFSAALAEAIDAGQIKDRQALARAAALVAELQQKDGSWRNDATVDLGAPATYGTALATHLALRVLQKADPERYQTAASRAEQWLCQAPVKSVLDAAAVLLALDGCAGKGAAAQRQRCQELIGKGQSRDGGWGPYVTSASEPFDTAVVLLALVRQAEQPGVKAMLRRGRAYLVATQQREGNWPETTRPAGQESYAQRLSTAGWATLALLATMEEK
jgi:hypothetical protein